MTSQLIYICYNLLLIIDILITLRITQSYIYAFGSTCYTLKSKVLLAFFVRPVFDPFFIHQSTTEEEKGAGHKTKLLILMFKFNGTPLLANK